MVARTEGKKTLSQPTQFFLDLYRENRIYFSITGKGTIFVRSGDACQFGRKHWLCIGQFEQFELIVIIIQLRFVQFRFRERFKHRQRSREFDCEEEEASTHERSVDDVSVFLIATTTAATTSSLKSNVSHNAKITKKSIYFYHRICRFSTGRILLLLLLLSHLHGRIYVK